MEGMYNGWYRLGNLLAFGYFSDAALDKRVTEIRLQPIGTLHMLSRLFYSIMTEKLSSLTLNPKQLLNLVLLMKWVECTALSISCKICSECRWLPLLNGYVHILICHQPIIILHQSPKGFLYLYALGSLVIFSFVTWSWTLLTTVRRCPKRSWRGRRERNKRWPLRRETTLPDHRENVSRVQGTLYMMQISSNVASM